MEQKLFIMKELLLISFLTISTYLIYVAVKYGIQKSISETYYTIGKKGWFTLIIWGMIIPLMIVGIEITDSFLIFLGGAAIVFVGASPAFKSESLEKAVHFISSYLGVGFVILATIFTFNFIILGIVYAILIALTFTQKLKINHHIWWIEISAYLLILIQIIINL
jgi:hypothetical protein